MRLKGSCLCGGIQYEVAGPLGQAMYCHCRICRKSNGAGAALNAPIRASDFTLLAWYELLTHYASSEDARRCFCARCGAPIYSQRLSMPELLRLRVGTLDDEVSLDKVAHIFVGSRARWDEIHDDLPQFDERPV